jgi:hypothetical protein
MYYVSTIILGWIIVNFIVNLINSFLGIESLTSYFFFYVLIGYIIMSIKKIPSPMNNGKVVTQEDSPYNNMKSIQLNLFFKEIYYTLWWPYYLIRKN